MLIHQTFARAKMVLLKLQLVYIVWFSFFFWYWIVEKLSHLMIWIKPIVVGWDCTDVVIVPVTFQGLKGLCQIFTGQGWPRAMPSLGLPGPGWTGPAWAGLGWPGPAPASGNLHFELLTSLGQPGLASAWPGQPSFQSFTGLGWPCPVLASTASSGRFFAWEM